MLSNQVFPLLSMSLSLDLGLRVGLRILNSTTSTSEKKEESEEINGECPSRSWKEKEVVRIFPKSLDPRGPGHSLCSEFRIL